MYATYYIKVFLVYFRVKWREEPGFQVDTEVASSEIKRISQCRREKNWKRDTRYCEVKFDRMFELSFFSLFLSFFSIFSLLIWKVASLSMHLLLMVHIVWFVTGSGCSFFLPVLTVSFDARRIEWRGCRERERERKEQQARIRTKKKEEPSLLCQGKNETYTRVTHESPNMRKISFAFFPSSPLSVQIILISDQCSLLFVVIFFSHFCLSPSLCLLAWLGLVK